MAFKVVIRDNNSSAVAVIQADIYSGKEYWKIEDGHLVIYERVKGVVTDVAVYQEWDRVVRISDEKEKTI